MTPTGLRYEVEHTGSYFFTRASMKFFGDTMKNYGVRSTKITTSGGEKDVWELYRKRPVKHGLSESAFFDKVTFAPVHAI